MHPFDVDGFAGFLSFPISISRFYLEEGFLSASSILSFSSIEGVGTGGVSLFGLSLATRLSTTAENIAELNGDGALTVLLGCSVLLDCVAARWPSFNANNVLACDRSMSWAARLQIS